ncbi:2-C-methyl-D-erythritol 4-phosphate cytidylyltransferase [Corynebacterium striatum]|uniref:2-C-methyl-D-erythritol 4-phosphate cytidylyltransferase n=1 Tax=Corynebacterium striatum TaxID=43770 RepID=UPI00019C4323|nr:2-C-methyl-D-erythritol 4-phosphate cytidylyltransferase [Corynebacterium striatum]EEI77536.1 2-C-methyl-D-erythritol 4-phosphate cytidylyltransferase [Corynebacterium striatum ATCC 6940]QQE51907.1 2-C-methyl-D-erythritol 4-phosphate cytidylyltransferase [Corynebacterium striatum]STD62941.1 2-C-methyl-D-erythritol 4-phosphate cytidylyltransferase [Corynebacterium striatum]
MTSPSTTKTNKPVVALIAAAGIGTRLGAEVPKAYVELQGRTLLERSVAAMAHSGVVKRAVVTVSPVMEDTARALLADAPLPITFVHGGGERADSVWAGLQAIDEEDAVVLIHDAARALTPPAMIARVAQTVLDGAPAVIPVLPVSDTIKIVDAERVVSTPDRSSLRAVQTPQGFDLATLRGANEKYFSGQQEFIATDDASLMEWFGVPVATVPGDQLALKITTPMDLTLATAILKENS